MSAIPNASPLEALPKRIQVEIQKLQQEPVPGVSCIPRANNSRHFDVLLQGPGDSPYEGGVFRLEIFLPAEYPLKPPRCRFLTRIYHPNIDAVGRICLDTINANWSPALRLSSVCLSLQALLASPNPDDPLANNVAAEWKKNERAAIATAKQWTRSHASGR